MAAGAPADSSAPGSAGDRAAEPAREVDVYLAALALALRSPTA
jgi:hypothetical protein